MSLFLDTKYASMLRNRVRNFKQVSRTSFNFSCPICGDSKRNPKKARGYLLQNHKHKDGLYYFCHNCNAAMPLWKLLKERFPMLYEDYKRDKLWGSYSGNSDKNEGETGEKYKSDVAKKFASKQKEESRESETQNDQNHKEKWEEFIGFPKGKVFEIIGYLKRRKIANEHIKKYFSFTKDFWGLAHYFTDGEIERKPRKEPRILIKMLDEHGSIIGFQGRALGPSYAKYITIKRPDCPYKVFGLDRVDPKKPVVICEGPIDSLFLANSLAVCGADLVSQFEKLGIGLDVVFCFDNEPRNKHIVRRMEKAIDKGYKVVIWPKDIEEKDINDMVIAGIDVSRVIEQNTFSGLLAKCKLKEWKKIR